MSSQRTLATVLLVAFVFGAAVIVVEGVSHSWHPTLILDLVCWHAIFLGLVVSFIPPLSRHKEIRNALFAQMLTGVCAIAGSIANQISMTKLS